ncbi:hypothetical protein CTEN210_09512 [Chaetoceros tenuissimus]|uniref:tRNA-5-taurinomethyluridine 2-sulfurtransferase n=1 Tax=Chaetoceros tenuissimus TaxID=426638 RepID=A0AAD3CVL2_9STRA|nr:hypothetical protein CTEN210_09512 [Chaetoceros tenuissimus]
MSRSKRIVVALSGGIDSSVSASLLKAIPNTNLIGLHMSNWNASDESSGSTYCEQSEKDAADAQTVADHLSIDMKRAEFQSEYWHGVFEPFLEGFAQNKTMNPDIGCNRIVKFGAMREYAMQNLHADYIATGHYARLWHRRNDSILGSTVDPPEYLEEALGIDDDWIYGWGKDSKDSCNDVSPLLLAGADLTKDQSYFLCGVHGVKFSNVLFPLGHLNKNIPNQNGDRTVRQIAQEYSKSIAQKKESMGICFIGKRNFADFISEYLPEEAVPGDFVDIDTGKVVGRHKGNAFYTIGQGAKISGASCKWFTCSKSKDGVVFVCNDTHHPSLYSNELYIRRNDFNWIGGGLPQHIKQGSGLHALCRTRHLQPLIPCLVELVDDNLLRVKFDRPVRGITEGQTASLYVGNGIVCLGGGQILKQGQTYHELGIPLPSKLHPSGNNDRSV